MIRPLLLCGMVLAASCVSVGQPEVPETGPEPRGADPAIVQGSASAAAEAEAARLIAQARAHYAGRRYTEAVTAAAEVVTSYPEVSGSASALWILARASMETGDFETAEVTAGQYAALLPDEDRRGGEAALVRARALAALDRPADAIAALLATSLERADQVRTPGLRFVRETVRNVGTDVLGDLADAADPLHPFAPRVRLEHALGLYYSGETEEAAQVARAVIDADADPPEVELAQSILSGGVERRAGSAPLLGALLPRTGSPLLQEYARYIEEGIRVAMQQRESSSRSPVELRVADDGGGLQQAVASIEFLENQGVLAVIGPLQEMEIPEVAGARTRTIPMISPTATMDPTEPSMYSLAATDEGGAQQLARYAAREGFQRIAVIYPEGTASAGEARAFRDELRDVSGIDGPEIREFQYPPGSTTYREPLEGARAFEAEALFLPLPEGDVELLAPQIAFFGVDSLGVAVLGTAGWAQPNILSRVDPRHLDGAVVSAPQDPGAAGATLERFKETYEAMNRRTLRSQIPAYGYDAAQLLIHAIEQSGARSPADVSRALEEIRDFPGATGTLSVVDGRIVRRHYLYRIDGGELIPLSDR